MARLGRAVFFDASLSSSGRLACATCHDPAHAYGPPGDLPVMTGGPDLRRPGVRAVPSLMYLERQPDFSIGPDQDDTGGPADRARMAALGVAAPKTKKSAGDPSAAAANLVPQGGLFWDGRADTLQQQALGPLLSPFEMDGGSVAAVAARLRRASYTADLTALFGPIAAVPPDILVNEAMFAVARFQIEEPGFHPYSSRYDFWLEGKARLTAEERDGYRLFNDPDKANCGGCHLAHPSADGLPPLFTDGQYEALGAPRNPAVAANRRRGFFDLGICGPFRTDMRAQTKYCGMFRTPTLRNVATRHAFFHNGVFRSLDQLLDFYNFRDVDPARVYPRAADGTILKYNDLPRRHWTNVDTADPPFDRHPGGEPAMTAAEAREIVAFLKTLTDGYVPGR